MKTLFGAIIFIIIFHFSATGQEKPELSGKSEPFEKPEPFEKVKFEKAKINGEEASKYFKEIIHYPAGRVDGNVFVSFIIDKQGKIDSIQVLNEENYVFVDEVLGALLKSSGLWKPTKFDGLALYKKYIAAFNFTATYAFQAKKDKCLRFIRLGNMTKALKMVNEAIDIDPYDIDLYRIRADIYGHQAKYDLQTLDLARCYQLNSDILFNIWFVNI